MSQAINKIVEQQERTKTQEQGAVLSLAERMKRAGRGWLVDEGRLWGRALGSPALYGLLLVSLLVLGLAWQVPFSYKINPEGELNLDEPFLRNFNLIEHTPREQPDGFNYRWSRGEARLNFPGIGKHDYSLKLRMANEPNPSPDYFIYANETMVAAGKFEPGLKDYDFKIPAQAMMGKNGDLEVRIDVKSFQVKGDNRDLGFVFISAELRASEGGGLTIPPPVQLGYLLTAIGLVYLMCARAGFKGWTSGGVAMFFALVLAYVVATPGARIWLTIFTQQLVFAFGLALFFVVLVDIPLRRVWGGRSERAWVLSIFGLALAIKLAGVLHPQIYMVDIGFHKNNFTALWDDGQWFRKITSTEWGNRETYYPATSYLFSGLFQWLISDRLLLLKVWMVVVESTRALLVYYLVRRVTGDGRAATIAAFMMAVLPVAIISLSFGQVANLFGEWLILAALCLVIVKYEQLRQPLYFGALTLVLTATFIQHPGVILLAGTAFLLIIAFMRLTKTGRRGWLTLLACYMLAIVLSFGLYHWKTTQDMIPQALETITNKVNGVPAQKDAPLLKVGGSVGDRRLGLKREAIDNFQDWFWGGLKGFWSEARVYYQVIPLLMLPWAFWWLWRTGKPDGLPIEPDDDDKKRLARRRLFWAGVAWFVVALIFALLGWTLNLYVRYSLFLLPFVAIGAGLFLGRLWKRQGWAGAALTFALSAYLTITTLAMYFDRVIYYDR